MPKSLRVAPEHIKTVKSALQRQGFRRQKDLAEALKLSPSTISKFLNGKSVDVANFVTICQLLELESSKIIFKVCEDIDDSINNNVFPGFKLRYKLQVQEKEMSVLAWSPDGSMLAAASSKYSPSFAQKHEIVRLGEVRVWNTKSGEFIQRLEFSENIEGLEFSENIGYLLPSLTVPKLTWSPDGDKIVAGYRNIHLWDVKTGKLLQILQEHTSLLSSLSWSPFGKLLASGSVGGTIRCWNTENGELYETLKEKNHSVFGSNFTLAWVSNGQVLISGSSDGVVRNWDAKTWELLKINEVVRGGINFITSSSDGKMIALACTDGSVRILSPHTYRQVNILEGHKAEVICICFSSNDSFLASKSTDGAVLLWNCKTWEQIVNLDKLTSFFDGDLSLAFHPTQPILATIGESEDVIRIWDLDYDILLNKTSSTPSIYYINAKAVLVGESGVGKSGLGIRMAEKNFRITESTHGAQFWQIPVTQRISSPSDNVEIQAELTLWDLAGQPDYHIVHQLFLNDTDVALLLFDCSDAAEPFRGVPYWAKVLKKQAPDNALKYLISARCDVSPPTVNQPDIYQILAAYNLDGYFCTSAKIGDGVEEVLQKLLESIPWDQLPRTTTPKLFQVIREYFLERKEDGDTLIPFAQVKQEVEQRYTERSPTQAELDTVVSLLQARGLVHRLEPTPNLAYVFLKPELINQYASSIIQAARNHPQGIGAILERDVICADFTISGFNRLKPSEEKIVLESSIELFIGCDLCFREMGMLVFPSQLNAPRREPDSHHPPTEVTYEFSGSIEATYASLVVRLSYTDYFQLHELRRYSAEFFRNEHRLGFATEQVEEGTGELEIYFYSGVSDFDRITFTRFITDHLRTKGIDIYERIRLYCPNSNCRKEVTNREAIEARIEAGKLDIPCQYCGTNVIIPESIEEHYRSSGDYRRKQVELKRIVEQRTKQEIAAFKADQKEYTMEQDTRLYLLHLSDIHLVTPAQARRYRTQLETDLKRELKVNRLHYLIISGDIANRSTKEEYDAAFELVDKLVKRFGLDSSRVVIVPGNHDLNWDLSEEAYPFIPKRKLPDPLPQGKYISAGDAGALLQDEKLYRNRFNYFNDHFYRRVYPGQEYPTDYAKQGILHFLPEDKILFLALNSCWEIDHYNKNRASINPDAIANACDRLLENNYEDWLKIAVWHHPITGQETMNDDFMQQLTVNGFQICMHGHIHEAKEGFYKYDNRRGLHIIGAGTFGAPTHQQVSGIPLQYNLLCIDPETDILTVETRRKEKVNGAWKADARWGDANDPKPRYTIQLG